MPTQLPASGAVPLLEIDCVRKSYDGNVVVPGLSVTLLAGQVVGLVGENGAGKSTVLGVLAGTVTADAGEVRIAGQVIPSSDPAAARRCGIAMVSQEFPLVDDLSVAENLVLGAEIRSVGPWIDARRRDQVARDALTAVGCTVRPGERMRDLSVGTRQLVEVAKAWCTGPRVLILDEPTSALGGVEAGVVLGLARRHADAGGVSILVSHRLDEVRATCDRVLVMRDGRLVADLSGGDVTERRLVVEMVGRDLSEVLLEEHRVDRPVPSGVSPGLRLVGVTASGLGPIDLSVHPGEIVGVAGLVGAGRSRLLHVIAGAQPMLGGEMEMEGRPYRPHSVGEAVTAGIGLVPEDRKRQSLFLDDSVAVNLSSAALPRLARWGFVNARAERALHDQLWRRVNFKARSLSQLVRTLSGGNQQRVVFARWLATQPRLLLLDDPTRGVDVAAKAEIYDLIEQVRAQGTAVVVTSSELDELFRLADRIVVMAHGHITAHLERSAFNKETIMAAATGTNLDEPTAMVS